jgi:MFS family permease
MNPLANFAGTSREMMAARFKGLNLSLVAIVIEGVLSRFSFGAINLALPLYARHLGLSLAEVGILLSINTAVALALKPLCSWAIDRFGQKRSFAVSIGLRSLAPLMFSLASMPWMLYGTAGVHGLSKSVRDPAVDSLIVEHSKRNSIGSSFAWYSTAKSVSGALGKGAAGIFLTLTASNYFLVFVLAGLISASSLLVVARFVREVKSQDHPRENTLRALEPGSQESEAGEQSKKPPFFMALLPFLGFGCFISGVGQMLDVLFPILAVEYAGMSEAEVGVVFMVATAVVLLAGPVWGWLSDHLSRKMVFLTAGISNALASAIFLAFPSTLGIAAGRLVDDVGKAAFRPAWGTVMGQIAALNPGRRGRVVGYLGMGKDAGEMAGPIIASLIWSVWGVPVLLGVRVALAIGAEIYSVTLLGHIKRLEAKSQITPPERPANRETSWPSPTVIEGS